MAIIIPSKNIYQKNNPKIIDNIIDNVSVGVSIPQKINEYNRTIYSNSIPSTEFQNNVTQTDADEAVYENNVQLRQIARAYVALQTGYLKEYTISFNRTSGNKTITKILTGKNESGENNIKHTVYYQYSKYSVTADNMSISGNSANFDGLEETLAETSNGSGHIPSPTVSISKTQNVSTASASITETDLTNLGSEDLSVTYDSASDQYKLTVTILTFLSRFSMSGGGIFGASTNVIIPADGTREIYSPTNVEIELAGDLISLDLEEGTITVGSGSNPYSLEGNELSQNSVNASSLGNNVLSQYQRGKETATLLCDISNYYNDYGGKIIGVNKPSRNKLPKSYDFGNTSKIGGITATALSDGGIRLEGTNTSGGRIFFNLTKELFGGEELICWEGTSFVTEQIGDNSYLTLSKFGEGISNVALGYNQHNTTTWLSVDNGVTVNAIVYPMLNEGQHIPYEAPDYSMAFSLYDEVIPFYKTPYGESPMSMDSDMPKVFSVLGSKVIYDGAVWQELSIQEKRKYEGSKGLSFLSNSLSGIGSFKGKYLFVPSKNTANNNIVTAIAYKAFSGNKQIEYVYVSDNIKIINSSAFEECNNLKNIHFSKSSLCESINAYAFYKCSNLIYIELPPNLKSISPELLSGCSNLERIFIPKSVTSIGSSPFTGCSKLKNVEIEDVISYCNTVLSGLSSSPFSFVADLYSNGTLVKHLNLNSDKLTEIKYAVFYGCNSIESVDLGDYLTTVKSTAFNACKNLKEIIIGKNLTSILPYAFNGCTNLKKVFYKGTEIEWNSISIGDYNPPLTDPTISTIYYYSETQPTEQGNFWHYVNGKPKIW